MSTNTLVKKTTHHAVKKNKKRAPADDIPSALKPPVWVKVIVFLCLIAAFIYFIAPLYWLLSSAGKSNQELLVGNPLVPGFDSLKANYDTLQAWTQGLYWRWVLNSLIYSVVSGVLGTLISVAAGYSLAKFTFKGRGAVQGLIMAGLLLPMALLTIPLYLMFSQLHLTNTMFAIIIPSCVSPFGVFLGMVYSRTSVPDEMIEAARIDGAGELRIFFTLVMRLLAPAMVTVFLFIFVATWNNFLLPLLMVSSPQIKPITLGLYGMMSYFNPTYGSVLQGALFGVIPLIILFLGLQRYWQAGLAAGSVKG